jgi:hypothetical protein
VPKPHIHILVIALLILAALLALGSHETAGNQQGPGINDRLGNLNGLCRLNGGVPGAYSTDTVVTRFYCQGGFLDGLYCDVYSDLTYCYWNKVGKASSATGTLHEITTAVQDLTFVTDLSVDTVAPLTLDMPDQPLLVEAVIAWNPSTEVADQARMIQVNACRHLGGIELVAADGRANTYTVVCEGGLLDSMWCSLGMGMSACFFEQPAASPDATTPAPSPAPAPSPETQPASSTPPDAPPTEAPTIDPTAPPAPTEPAAPTDEPVIEPTFVDPATDDPWNLPEGTLQPFEPAPTPTPLPLT